MTGEEPGSGLLAAMDRELSQMAAAWVSCSGKPGVAQNGQELSSATVVLIGSANAEQLFDYC